MISTVLWQISKKTANKQNKSGNPTLPILLSEVWGFCIRFTDHIPSSVQNDFLRTAADAVHAAHPFHLVGGFERFGHIFLLCHSGNDDFHTLVAGLVDLGKVPMQRSACEQVCVENWTMLFQIAAAHTPVLADLVFRFIRQRKVGNEDNLPPDGKCRPFLQIEIS